MPRQQVLVIIAVVAAILSLCLSLAIFLSISQINAKIKSTNETVQKMDFMVKKWEPLAPEFELLKTLMPQLRQLLLGVPPVPGK